MATKHFYHKDRALNSKSRRRCSVKSKKSGQGNTFCCTDTQTLACFSLTLLFSFPNESETKKKNTRTGTQNFSSSFRFYTQIPRKTIFFFVFNTRAVVRSVCDFFIKLCSNSNEFRHFISISFRLFRSNSTGFLIMNLFKYANGYFVNTTNPIER